MNETLLMIALRYWQQGHDTVTIGRLMAKSEQEAERLLHAAQEMRGLRRTSMEPQNANENEF
jgi:hypothetical protein